MVRLVRAWLPMKMEEIHKFMLKLLALGLQTKRTYVRSQMPGWGTPPKLQTKTLAFYVETFGLGAADKAHICALENRIRRYFDAFSSSVLKP